MSKQRINIDWGSWRRLVNDAFVPFVHNRDRYYIHWGTRGSGKSDATAKKLIYRCLTEKYFRYLLIRRQHNTIKDSQYQTLKDIIKDLGLSDLFEFIVTPLEIRCVNGNTFLARGCDDTTKIKSIKDPTGAWYEEDIVDEADFITITTCIRTGKAAYLQEVFTLNPEVEGDYRDNWLWKRFFSGRGELSFSSDTAMALTDGREARLTYTVQHSTYRDNRWLHAEFGAYLESLKDDNPYYYTIYTLGHWTNKVVTGLFYKLFSRATNTAPLPYDSHLPIHLSFDFNVRPYITCTVWQLAGKKAMQIDEVCSATPHNTTAALCAEIRRRYGPHKAGLFVYGDPAGAHRDTRTETGTTDYTIILKELAPMRPSLRLLPSAPSVAVRGGFINQCFAHRFDDIEILIGENCTHTIDDYLYIKEAADGTKLKEKARDKEGVAFEKYGHTSDANDYLLTTAFAASFERYRNGGAIASPGKGYNHSKNLY
jgi:phage terminase large subunit